MAERGGGDSLIALALRRARWVLRLVAALAFWLHALLLLRIDIGNATSFAPYLGLTHLEASIGCFFVAVALLNAYGLHRFALDLLYIYGFPWIALFQIVRGLVRISWRVLKAFRNISQASDEDAPWASVLLLLGHQQIPSIEASSKKPGVVTDATSAVPTAESTRDLRQRGRTLWESVKVPFVALTSAWCLLGIFSTKTWILQLSLVIISLHLLRFIVQVIVAGFFVNRTIGDLERKIDKLIKGNIAIITGEKNIEDAAEKTRAYSLLIVLRIAAFLVGFRRELIFGVHTFVLAVYLLLYFRIALLFGVLYAIMAKLGGVPFSLVDAMVSAIFMPLTYGDLPRMTPFKVTGGIHAMVVIVLGFGAVSAYVTRRIEGLRKVANQVWLDLDREEIKTKLAELAHTAGGK